jgi:hypothetical protein
MPFNADVLEIIAEYACATVKDACALRAACKGDRRAVDTTIRRWVYAAQPEVRRSSAADGGQRPLYIDRDDAGLDAVRIAFTCDAFVAIVRLVVVAFALDGAKDEAHEAAECGVRPVDAVGVDLFPLFRVDAVLADSHWFRRAPPPIFAAFSRCTVRATVTAGDGLALPLADTTGAGEENALPWLTELTVAASTDADEPSVQCVVRLLRAVAAQLTKLTLLHVDDALCGVITGCRSLKTCAADPMTAKATAALCDALIASGASIEAVEIATGSDGAQDVARLLSEVPTIVRVHTGIGMDAVPPAVRERLELFNHAVFRLPRSTNLHFQMCEWTPSDFATRLTVGRGEALRITNFASAFPKLTIIAFDGLNEDHARELGQLRFPERLAAFSATTWSGEDATALLRGLAAHGSAALPCLSSVRIMLQITTAHPVVDITPLTAFASTLTHLEVGICTRDELDDTRHDEPLSLLVALVSFQFWGLPSTRCFLGGRHTRLRFLTIPCAESPGAPFAQLAKACPRLVQVRCAAPPDQLPVGWVVSRPKFAGTIVSRTSYLHPSVDQ